MVVCCPLSLHSLHRPLTAAFLRDFRHLVVVVLLWFFRDNSRLTHWLWTGHDKAVMILLSTVINGAKLSFAAIVPAQSLHVKCSSSNSLIFICHYDHANTLEFFSLVSLICGSNCSLARSLLLLKLRLSRIEHATLIL